MRVDSIGALMFSNTCADRLAEGEPEVLLPKEQSRLQTTLSKARFGLENGKPLSKLKCVTYAEALFEAMIHRFYEDPTMVAYGEENRDWGGAFAVYQPRPVQGTPYQCPTPTESGRHCPK